MSIVWIDIRFGIRLLLQKPGFTTAAVLALALGIGANTAIFTLFDAILLESLPVRDPARLVLFSDSVGEGTTNSDPPPGGRWNRFSSEVYAFLRAQPLPFSSIAAVRSGEDPVSVRFAGTGSESEVERANAHLVSGDYFDTLGVRAVLGRCLAPSDDLPNAAPAAVISYNYWKERLASDPHVAGKAAILNGTSFTIVGVTPPEFFGETVRRPPDFWISLTFQPQIELRPSFITRSDYYWLNLIARLRSGATAVQAQNAASFALRNFLTDRAGSKLDEERKRAIASSFIKLQSGAGGISNLRFVYSQPLHILLYVVALVLLIACANVGNLLLARGAARRSEISVRLALGASRARLVRQLLTENLLLAMTGAACGVLLAHWAVNGLIALVAKNSPMHPHLNVPVLGFTIGVALVAGLLFGLAPAVVAGRTDLVTSLKAGSRSVAGAHGRFGTSQLLVIGQIGVSLVLTIGASLLARSLVNLEEVPLGFDRDHVLLMRVNPRLAGYQPESVAPYYQKLCDELSALPGIRSATLASYSPFSGTQNVSTISVQGFAAKPNENPRAEGVYVAPGYPQTMDMTLLAGRAIGVQDGAGAPLVAMVNETFVQTYLDGGNAIGRRFGFGDSGEHNADFEVIGILKDARFRDPQEKIIPTMFLALLQNTSQFVLTAEVAVRTAGEASLASGEVRQAIGRTDTTVPVSAARTLRDQIDSTFNQSRVAARLVSLFGALALLLASVGLYGVVSQNVARRTNEIGVRMALGAQRGAILRMVLRETLRMLAIGVVIGIPSALGAARLLSSQLFAVRMADPFSLLLGLIVLCVVTVVAGYLPARKASRVEPIIALRYE